MLILVDSFKGMAPRVHPQSLPNDMAVDAVNCKLWSGALRPYYGVLDLGLGQLFKAGSGIVDSLFRFNVAPSDADTAGTFFHWQGIAHAVRAPLAGDANWTTIISGDGLAPRITDNSQNAGPDFPTQWDHLGLPVPNVAGTTATVVGTADPDANAVEDAVARDYVVAFVNARGQLGPTSDPIIPAANWLPGQTVDLAGLPGAPGSPYGTVTDLRIYRLGQGGTTRYFVAQIPIGQATYNDAVDELALGEASLSAGYEEPPSTMENIGVMSNGICYGSFRNQVCISEAFLPHAWNPLLRETLNYDIVAMGHIGTSIVAVTGEAPYVIYGVAAGAMRQERINVNQGCLSQQGLVSGPFGVAYPSKDGLVLVRAGSADVVTEAFFTRDEWQDYRPETFKGALYADRYLAFYDDGVNQGTLIIDPSNLQFGLVRSDVHGTALYADPVARSLYMVEDGTVKQWDADRANPLTYEWRSKEFVSRHHVAVNWGRVLADGYTDLVVDFYVDGVLHHGETVTSNRPFPMPAGVKGRIFQFEVRGTETVTQVAFASSPREFPEWA